jgi:uncharacterized protein YutE (UPF0331/DUF86 family)
MVNVEIILRKLKKLQQYVNELRHAKDISWQKYKKKVRDRAFVERYIHMAIERVLIENQPSIANIKDDELLLLPQ